MCHLSWKKDDHEIPSFFFLNIAYLSHFHTKPGEMSIKFKLKEKKKADDSSSAQNHRI